MGADRTAIEAETISRLQTLIRFETVNPPGNELPLAEYLAREFETEGIETTLLVRGANRAAVIARLRGKGTKRPVMLMAHMDVVAVEREKWSYDPFEGVVSDGYLYGRGAIDDKGMLTANMMTMLLLGRSVAAGEIELDRDVVFLATSDEEAGGADGIKWLVSEHRELLDAEFAINEGGRARIIAGGKRYIAIQTAEKISHMVTVTARGPAGHAAIPLAGNAILRLGRALARISDHSEPVVLGQTTRTFFSELSSIWPDERERRAMAVLVSEDARESAEGAAAISQIPVFNALIRNGISATRVEGGVAGNVIPAEASAQLNVRTIPGQPVDEVLSRLRACVDDPEVTVTLSTPGDEAPASSADSPMYSAIAECARELDPKIVVVPYLSTGATDSSHLRRIGIDCYGLLPFPMEQADEARMHGHDERVPVASLHYGTQLIFGAVRTVAAA